MLQKASSSVILNKHMIFQKINDWSTYVLIALLWAPHATKECVEVCNGPVFVSPTLVAFFTPFVQMDISTHGFLMQFLYAPIFIGVMFLLFYIRDHIRFGKILNIYIIRWTMFGTVLVVLYNLLFWGGLRSFIFPSFIF